MRQLEDARIAVVGLGYVGLPLAVEFGKQFDTIGFDLKAERIEELRAGKDSTLEVEPEALAAASRLSYVDSPEGIAGCNVYIVTVPTPVGQTNRPVLTPLKRASESEHQRMAMKPSAGTSIPMAIGVNPRFRSQGAQKGRTMPMWANIIV